jgi:crotonobetainyl-CoA:carnitine CoA-transferase CaiB-like acyl-CoA transferase
MAPAFIHKTRDGKFVAIAAGTDEQFKALCTAMGQNNLATKYPTELDRLKPENARELNRIAQEWVSQKDAAEIVDLAKQHGFPAAEVVDDYQITHEEWRQERGSVETFYDEMYHEFILPGPQAILSKSPSKVKWLCRPVGYHNRYILKGWLKLSDEELQELEKKKVIGYWDDRPGAKPPIYYDIGTDPIFNYRGNGGGAA